MLKALKASVVLKVSRAKLVLPALMVPTEQMALKVLRASVALKVFKVKPVLLAPLVLME